MSASTAIEVVARAPHVEGPLAARQFACPASNIAIDAPRLDLDSRFNESFTSFRGNGRLVTPRLVAGENGLAALIGNVRFAGTLNTVLGSIDASARQSRLGPISAERTRIEGRYLIGAATGTMAMIGDYAANNASLAPNMLAGVTEPLAAAQSTPIGPIASAMGRAISNTVRSFDASGSIRVVNFPGGGAARIESANVSSNSGARVRVSGGDGVTYYWPSGRLRFDGLIQMAGGGLPTGRVLLRQPRSGAPMSGLARFEPYQVGASRLALDPIRFRATREAATDFSTTVMLDGPFQDGRVQGLRLPLNGRLGTGGAFSVGRGCIVASWQYFRMQQIQFGPTRLPVCPIGHRPTGSGRRAPSSRENEPAAAGRPDRQRAPAAGRRYCANCRQGLQLRQVRGSTGQAQLTRRVRCQSAARDIQRQRYQRGVRRSEIDDRERSAPHERGRWPLAVLPW
jgi:translocation and assembly module TamB